MSNFEFVPGGDGRIGIVDVDFVVPTRFETPAAVVVIHVVT